MAFRITADRIAPGMTIADLVYDGNRVIVSARKEKVRNVLRDACQRRKVHVNDTGCYDAGAEVWVMS